MTTETKSKIDEQLILKSIKHWEEMRRSPRSSSPYACDCPLCSEYVLKNNSCNGCPIKIKTGHQQCDGTPWSNARDEWDTYNKYSPVSRKAWRKAATAEIRFLRSLLPKKKTKKRKE